MKKIKFALKTMIVIAIVVAFTIPESAIKTNTAPNIIINFAGNPGDNGGPYWAVSWEDPTWGEVGITADDGYYTNDSRQIEDWIYIHINITGVSEIDQVWLNWLNDTTWTNLTYEFIYIGGDEWEFNSSGIINTAEGHDYSFDIVVKDTIGNSYLVSWDKKGLGGRETRRYVQLGCIPANITYKPFYLGSYTSETGTYEHISRKDRLHHDQGPDGGLTDTGYLNSTLSSDEVEERRCGIFTGYWFEDSICIEPFTLSNIYYHFWYNSSSNDLDLAGWSKSRDYLKLGATTDFYDPPDTNGSHSSIVYDEAEFFLDTHLLQITPSSFTDNDIYELFVIFHRSKFLVLESATAIHWIRTITNRSFISFVLLNVPDNETLNTSYFDSDNDGLTDWTELYVTYTNPFLADTDKDSATDYEEVNGASHGYLNSDPNDYTDTTEYRHVGSGGPYVGLINEPIQFTGSVVGGSPPYSWHWDFGDGYTSDMQNPLHEYTSTGVYTITLNVSDSGNYSNFDSTIATIGDLNARISKPESAIYFNNEMIMPRLFLKKPIIIGSIDLEIEATDSISGVNKVEFYIDNQLKETDTTEPYSWRWDERTLSKHKLKVVAYDTIGNIVSDEIIVWKFL